MSLTNIDSYSVSHNKNGGGGTIIYNGNKQSSNFNSIHTRNINATQGSISYLQTKSISANDANIMYLTTKEGKILKLDGEQLSYKSGYIGELGADTINAKKLSVDDIDALKAWIATLNSKEITTEYLTVTKQAHFFELIIDKIRSVGGQLILTPASCQIDYVKGYDANDVEITDLSSPNIAYYNVYWRNEDETGRLITNDFITNDQVICQSFNNASTGTNYNVSNKYYWRLVEGILPDIYVNLSTGAMTSTQSQATANQFEISMLNTKIGPEIYNEIQWDVQEQSISGIYTNVSWSDVANTNYAANGLMTTASQVYGIQITPITSADTTLPITSELDFIIKQLSIGNTYNIPENINIGVYFADDTFMLFNDVQIGSDYSVHIDLGIPEAPIEAITIVSSNAVDWHLCHGMRISNTDKDVNAENGSAIPSIGDNLVQLGYRGTDDDARQSAIIISAYKSPDPDVKAPSYAQYMGINDFDLLSHRGSYMDANGAKFVGDITMCTVNGKSINDTVTEQTELNNKKLILSTNSCRIYRDAVNPNTLVAVPSALNASVLVPAENGITTLTNVPEGYTVTLRYYSAQNAALTSFDRNISENESLSGITFSIGQEIDSIGFVRVTLLKNKNGVEMASWPVVDYKDITYLQGTVDVEDGGHWEFRYQNATVAPTKPATGTSGLTDGWTRSATTPDFANGYFTWMTQCFVTANETYGEWTDVVRITGDNGEDGADGKDVEYVYTRNNTGTAPAAPPLNQIDDWYGTDTNGVTWTDSPQGVASNMMYEYVSMRIKRSTWGLYSTPVIWSKWGEKGMDGDGYEYIYKVTQTYSTPSTPIDSPQTDDFVPTGWTDDPAEINQSNPYQWVSVRKKNAGTWGSWSAPVLWSRYAEQGETGGHYEFRYKNATSQPSAPTGSGTSDGWAINPSNPDIDNKEYTWMSQCYVTPSTSGDSYGTWSTPIRITGGEGEDGADGTDIEFVYSRNNTGTAPAAPATNQTDDWSGVSDGVTWTDNPQGVQSDMMYEYISVRYKTNGTWSAYSTPVVWSKWGEKGMDGDGYEYIYKITATADVPANPTPSDYQTNINYRNNDYVPTGWTDDPQSVSESTPYEWVCIRERKNGTWGTFSTPALWSRWAQQGSSGGHYEFRYKNATSQPSAPTGTGETDDWSRAAVNLTDAQIEAGYVTWMSQCYVTGNDAYGTWTTPVRITGPRGKAGEDGNDIEFIYTRNNTGTAPSTPATSQTDDYVPSGWYDNPQGVSSTMMYEYISTRHKENGTWSVFSTPVVWSKWGEKGMDGDGYEYIYRSTSNSTAPSKPTDSPQQDDHVPSGWSDEPVTLSSTNAFLWVCVRKKTNGTWGAWSTPALWSHYATAEGGQPGADGNDAEFNYLIPNKEILIAKFINAISDNTNCDLLCDLDYSLVHVKGSSATIINWSSTSYTMQMIAYNREYTNIWSRYMSNNGYASGTVQGTYSNSNLMATINSNAAQQDYMKCYKDYPSRCPIYIEVILRSGNVILDKRIVNVELETGAVLKVTDDAINSAVAKSNTNMNTTLNNYSTTQQTAELINNTVNAQMSNYATTTQMNSAINQKADSIISTVNSTHYTKDEVDALLNDENSFSQVLDLLNGGYSENNYYPVKVAMNITGNDSTAVANGLIATFQVDRSLDESGFGTPSYGSRYDGNLRGFALCCNWNVIPSQWGEWGSGEMYINQYILKYTGNSYSDNDSENTGGTKVIGNLEQHNPTSTMVFYLRGGSKYHFRYNWPGIQAEIKKSGFTTDASSENKTYNVIYGADSSQITVPQKDKMNKSEIVQTSRQISLNVYQQTDEGLKKTGIDIGQGRITLKGEDTDVIGNLNVRGSGSGFQFTDDNGNVGLRIENSTASSKDDFLKANFTNWFKGVKVYRNAMMGETDKMSIGIWSAGTISISQNAGYLRWRDTNSSGQFNGTGVRVYLKPSLWCISNNIYQRIGSTGTETNTLLNSSGYFANAIGGGSWTAPRQQEYFISYEWRVTGLTFRTSTDYYDFNYSFKYTPNKSHPHIDFTNNGFGIQFNYDINNFFYTGNNETEISYTSDGSSKFRVDHYGVHVGRRVKHCPYRSDATLEYIGDYYLEYNYPYQPGTDQWNYDTYKNAFNFTGGGKYLIAGDYFRIFNLTDTAHRYKQLSDNTTNGVVFRIIKSNNNSLTNPSCAITSQSGTSVDIIIPKWSIMTGIWDGEKFMCYFTFFN